jgi:hypothetical protein
MPIPVNEVATETQVFDGPQLGLGAGVGARVVSQQTPILHSGRLECIRRE